MQQLDTIENLMLDSFCVTWLLLLFTDAWHLLLFLLFSAPEAFLDHSALEDLYTQHLKTLLSI